MPDDFDDRAKASRLERIRAERGTPERVAQMRELIETKAPQSKQPNPPLPARSDGPNQTWRFRWSPSSTMTLPIWNGAGRTIARTSSMPRSNSHEYLMLHRVGCLHLTGDLPWTTTDKCKICPPTTDDIDAWCTETFSAYPERCGTCQP